MRLGWWRYRVSRIPHRMLLWLVWHLPEKVVFWSAIRVGAHATTGAYSDQVVPELRFMDALERWDKK